MSREVIDKFKKKMHKKNNGFKICKEFEVNRLISNI